MDGLNSRWGKTDKPEDRKIEMTQSDQQTEKMGEGETNRAQGPVRL